MDNDTFDDDLDDSSNDNDTFGGVPDDSEGGSDVAQSQCLTDLQEFDAPSDGGYADLNELLNYRRNFWKSFKKNRVKKWGRFEPEKSLLLRLAREAKSYGFLDPELSDYDAGMILAPMIYDKMP